MTPCPYIGYLTRFKRTSHLSTHLLLHSCDPEGSCCWSCGCHSPPPFIMLLNRKLKADIQESIVDANISMRSAAPSRWSSCLAASEGVISRYRAFRSSCLGEHPLESRGSAEARSGVQLDQADGHHRSRSAQFLFKSRSKEAILTLTNRFTVEKI